jgi:cytochrome c553
MRKFVAGFAAIACVTGTVAFAQSANQPVAGKAEATVTSTCQNCHGPRGNSVSATFPRLNGQQADYITAQLKNFRDHSRSDPHARAYMWGMAAQLDDKMIEALAHYYTNQKPTAPQIGGTLADQGAAIFKTGLRRKPFRPASPVTASMAKVRDLPRASPPARRLSEKATRCLPFVAARKRRHACRVQGHDRQPDRSAGFLSRQRLRARGAA